MPSEVRGTVGFEHDALMYTEREEFLAATCAFIGHGLDADEAVMVAVPGAKIPDMRRTLGREADAVRFADMNLLGRNPGRIIPELREWIAGQGSRSCRFIGEPIWPERTTAETVEATRHEALINIAFNGADVHILCPYDAARLDPGVLADAERTHPHLVCGACRTASAGYAEPLGLWASDEWPLAEPNGRTLAFEADGDLRRVRSKIADWASAIGIPPSRVADLVLAVNEAVTNALMHGRPPFAVRAWPLADRAVCEVTDHGRFDTPLAGRVKPAPDWPSGRGVWLMNQMCDLVEVRPGEDRTTVRLHISTAA